MSLIEFNVNTKGCFRGYLLSATGGSASPVERGLKYGGQKERPNMRRNDILFDRNYD